MKNTKSHSLQRQITLSTLMILLISAVVAGAFAFKNSYDETGELFDEQLKDIAHVLLASNPKPQSYQADDDNGLWIDIFTQNNHALANTPTGFSTSTIDGERFQVYHLLDNGKSIVIRQRSESQDELATLSAMHSLIPLLAVSGILMLVLPLLIWHSFRSVRLATKAVSQRQTHDLSSLTVDSFPKEILPFAHAINTLLNQAQDDINTQKRFIADASHELRSPLTAISLQVQRLQHQNDPEKIQIGLDKLAKSIAQNQDLVEKLLTIARLDGKIWATNPTDLSEIIKNTINLLLPIINDKGLEIDVNIHPHQVNIDSTALLLLVKNIIQNAVIYTPSNGKIVIILSTQAKQLQSMGQLVVGQGKPIYQASCLLQIKDSGMGVSSENYQHIFQPFARVSHSHHSDSSSSKGTGLGLSIVKTVCEQANIDLYLNQSQFTNHQGGLCVTLVF